METANRVLEIQARLFELETTMVNTYREQEDRNREQFVLSAELEQLTAPASYEQNKAHWEGHELRF